MIRLLILDHRAADRIAIQMNERTDLTCEALQITRVPHLVLITPAAINFWMFVRTAGFFMCSFKAAGLPLA